MFSNKYAHLIKEKSNTRAGTKKQVFLFAFVLSLLFCAMGYAQGYGGQGYGGNGQYGQNPYGQNSPNTIRDIPALSPGQSGLSETGADRQISDIDKQIDQLTKRAGQLQQQGQACEQQANQVFFYDSLRARTLIHEADSYQAQAAQIQMQIAQLKSKKDDLQRYAH